MSDRYTGFISMVLSIKEQLVQNWLIGGLDSVRKICV